MSFVITTAFSRYEHDMKDIKKSVIELRDDEQKYFVNNSFQPYLLSFSGFRILITQELDWEFKENPYIYNIDQFDGFKKSGSEFKIRYIIF